MYSEKMLNGTRVGIREERGSRVIIVLGAGASSDYTVFFVSVLYLIAFII